MRSFLPRDSLPGCLQKRIEDVRPATTARPMPKAIDGVPVRWLNSHYLNVEPLVARTYGAIPPSLPFSHYRFAERARRFGRHDRLAKQLHKVIDTSGAVPRLADAAVSNLECGAACPTN